MSRINLATMYGTGLVKRAPGTAGSAVAALMAWVLLQVPFGWQAMSVGCVLFTIWGTSSTTRYMASQATAHDPKEVVIDELVGQWLTYLLPFWFSVWAADGDVMDGAPGFSHAIELLVYILCGFILFRFFDILKPWPICLADRKVKGGFGVMFDDILAAIPAAILLLLMPGYILSYIHG